MRKLALLAVLGLLAACVQTSAPSQPPQVASACSAPLKPALEINLFFGRDIEGGGEVSERQWAEFVASEVTPRFPDGLSVLNVAGQSRNSMNQTLRERTKLLVVVVFDAPAHHAKVQAIGEAYSKRFGQHGVFRTEHTVCAGV
ncbi:MAG: DUF3574 domain-containing protein [Rhodospirillales bacterium]|nr:DUF3574 domain-containing protein [Rhodospirillales bacterium]